MKATKHQLSQVDYIDVDNIRGRTVQLMPMWDGGKWQSWHPGPDDKMIKLAVAELAAGDYVAKKEARESDLYVPFIDLVWQHVSYAAVTMPTFAISEDLSNFATSLAKIDFFWSERERIGHGTADFVRTEVEYMLVVARSLLDHLHEVMLGVWSNIQLLHPAQQERKKRHPLPRKLTRAALKDGAPRPATELTKKHALPAPIADFYERAGRYLASLRGTRDAVVHGGRSTGPIFVTDKGFGISRDGALARMLRDEWNDDHSYNDNVLSLRPLLAHVSVGCLYVCEEATKSVASCIGVLKPIAPGYRVFTRVQHGEALLRAQEILHGGDAWWG